MGFSESHFPVHPHAGARLWIRFMDREWWKLPSQSDRQEARLSEEVVEVLFTDYTSDPSPGESTGLYLLLEEVFEGRYVFVFCLDLVKIGWDDIQIVGWIEFRMDWDRSDCSLSSRETWDWYFKLYKFSEFLSITVERSGTVYVLYPYDRGV